MSRRRLHIALHWTVVFTLLAMVKGGSAAPGLRWTFVAAVAVWIGVALLRGLYGRPGPKLSAVQRVAYRPAHMALYAVLGISAALNAGELLGWLPPGNAWTSLLIVLGLGTLHGLFQFWRHTALMDGALRLIVPKFLYHLL